MRAGREGEERAGRAQEERPLAGLGRFSGMVAVATVVGVAFAAVALWAYGPGSGGAVRDATRAALAGDSPAPTPSPSAAPSPPPSPASPAQQPVAPAAVAAAPSPAGAAPDAPLAPAAEEAAAIAREVERRRAAGALQEAAKRFAPCEGGDVRRTATVDGDHVVKLEREQADGVLVEEWFDRSGRLREARLAARGVPGPPRRLLLDGRGATVLDTGGGPEGARLDRGDPSRAFFDPPACGR